MRLVTFYPFVLLLDAETAQLEKSHSCPHCLFKTNSAVLLQGHLTANHNNATLQSCPLCSDKLLDHQALQKHLFSAHNVNKEGALKLLAILDTQSWSTKEERELSCL